jgi:glycosyltransferase involved in cell wall biosynthesis
MAGKLGLLKSWVREAIKQEVQVILVHDCNDEETGDELSEFVELLDSNAITLIQGNFGSPGLARNAGMSFIDSEWVAFWDSDDLPDVSRALNLISTGISYKKTVLVGSFSKVNISKPQAIEHVLFKGSPNSWINQIAKSPGLWRFIIHRSRLQKIPFSKFKMGEDQLLIEELLEFSGDFFFCNDLIYTYHIGNQFQATRSKTARADIDKLVMETVGLYKKSIRSYRIILAPFLIRQTISAIKYLEISTLISLIFQMMKITRLWMLLEALLFTLVANRSRSLM